jgi:hypothetical protein
MKTRLASAGFNHISTLLCSTYVMFLLISKGVRILATIRRNAYTRGHFS